MQKCDLNFPLLKSQIYIYIQVFELDRFSLDIIEFSLDIISLDIMVHISEKEFETINGLLIK